jgi:hypothetical protein
MERKIIMNLIEQVRHVMNDNCEVVRFAFWTDEMAVYLWEDEVGITVLVGDNKIYFDCGGYDFKLDCGQMMILAKVMEVLYNNMDEIKRMTASVD